jgi:fatty acid elongase 3
MISTLVSMMHEFDWATAGGNSLPVAGAFAGAYLVMVVAFVSSKSLREGCKFEFPKKCIPYHNLFLSIASLIMFAGTLFYTIERVQKNGWEWLLCDTCSEAKGPLWFFSYLYYLSKYYELLDTVLQFFSGKMPPNLFLHVRNSISQNTCVVIRIVYVRFMR